MQKYTYIVKGTAARGQTWEVKGHVSSVRGGQFPAVLSEVLRLSFVAVVDGTAVYGHPGAGCQGPYTIGSFLVEQEKS